MSIKENIPLLASKGENVFQLDSNREVFAVMEEVGNLTTSISSEDIKTEKVKGAEYVNWGEDNQYPQNLIKAIRNDEVLSPNKELTVKTCYGAGLMFKDLITGEKTTDKDVKKFMMRNNLPYFLINQITDFKYFFISIDVIILNAEAKKIVQVRHKSMVNCRLAPMKNGVIPYVVSADFSKSTPENIEKIPLLDIYDPLGDLLVRLGREPGDDGKTGTATEERKFAVMTIFPTPGDAYYPTPYYTSFVRSKWYDIKQLIPIAKKAKLKNISSLRYVIEIHEDYWQRLINNEKIYDEQKQNERIALEKKNIIAFVSGLENSGKTLFTTMYKDLKGETVADIRITVLNSQKEGGDWSEDIAEASSVACYSDGIHPNMIGAAPGKSGMNNSGSDKRELFTMKQSMETTFHHLILNLFNVIIEFNGWNVEPIIPMITLTTLDKHKDAELTTPSDLNDTRNE